MLDTAKEIVSEGGITALWTGLKPGLVLTVNPAITYGVFERLKTWRLAERGPGGKLGVGEAFWMGVVSKTLATVVTYPYIFVRPLLSKAGLQMKPCAMACTARARGRQLTNRPKSDSKPNKPPSPSLSTPPAKTNTLSPL